MREFTSHNFTAAILSREGYRVLGDELNSWTQGGCWVLAQALREWAGPRAALYVLFGQQESGARGSPLLKEMGHHVFARIGDYYLDADGIDRGGYRLRDTWSRVEGLHNVRVETFLPRHRVAAKKAGLVCPPAAVKRVVALLRKHFGPGEAATTWMGGQEVRPNGVLYYFHATTVENAWSILEEGKLTTHRPDYGTDQGEWPDGSRERRTYFGSSPTRVAPFYPEGRPLLLRIPADAAAFKAERGTGDFYVTKSVPIAAIEFLSGVDTWLPLSAVRANPVTDLVPWWA